MPLGQLACSPGARSHSRYLRPTNRPALCAHQGANFIAAWASVLKEFGVPLKVLSVFYRGGGFDTFPPWAIGDVDALTVR